jgi:hypothetical protein
MDNIDNVTKGGFIYVPSRAYVVQNKIHFYIKKICHIVT